MACIQPDGTLSVTATVLLEGLTDGPMILTEITKLLRVPGFMVRANLRELVEAGLIRQDGEAYRITDEGRTRV